MPRSISHLESIGFLTELPEQVNIDDYEVIAIKVKSGEKLRMYRRKNHKIDEEDLENFTKSWDTFQKNLS